MSRMATKNATKMISSEIMSMGKRLVGSTVSRTELSALALASIRPLGENARQVGGKSCASLILSSVCSVLARSSAIPRSEEPTATYRPCGLTAIVVAGLWDTAHDDMHLHVSASHIMT